MPPVAASSRPTFAWLAPVNAPRSWPKSSLSSRLSLKRGAVERQERLVGARRRAVDGLGQDLLAGAGLAEDEDVAVCRPPPAWPARRARASPALDDHARRWRGRRPPRRARRSEAGRPATAARCRPRDRGRGRQIAAIFCAASSADDLVRQRARGRLLAVEQQRLVLAGRVHRDQVAVAQRVRQDLFDQRALSARLRRESAPARTGSRGSGRARTPRPAASRDIRAPTPAARRARARRPAATGSCRRSRWRRRARSGTRLPASSRWSRRRVPLTLPRSSIAMASTEDDARVVPRSARIDDADVRVLVAPDEHLAGRGQRAPDGAVGARGRPMWQPDARPRVGRRAFGSLTVGAAILRGRGGRGQYTAGRETAVSSCALALTRVLTPWGRSSNVRDVVLRG